MGFARASISLPGSERAILPFGRDKHIIHATAADTQGSMGVFEAIIEPGSGPHWHTHTREDEMFRVITGCFRFWCGDAEPFDGGVGTVVVAPCNVRHRWTNVSNEIGRMLVAVTPGGFEAFFYEIAAQEELSADLIQSIEAKYGVIGEL
jgi:quercetin dioxygenase-like cupin family protein